MPEGSLVNKDSTTIGADSDVTGVGRISFQTRQIERMSIENDGSVLVDGEPIGGSGGDASTNTSETVADQLPLFADATGKLLKEATSTGGPWLKEGVLTVAGMRVSAKSFPGADLGAQINAADDWLGSNHGEIWVEGGGSIVTPVVLQSYHHLRLGPGLITCDQQGAYVAAFKLKDHTSVRGVGWETIIREPTYGTSDTIGTWTVFKDYNGQVVNESRAEDIHISDLQILGAHPFFDSTMSAINLGNTQSGSVRRVWLNGTRSLGIGCGGSPVTTEIVNVSGASNALPIIIQTQSAHTFKEGDRVTVANVGGNTAANGSWFVDKVFDSTHVSLRQAQGNGAYTSGGTIGVNHNSYKVAIEDNLCERVASQNIYCVNGKLISMSRNVMLRAGQAFTGFVTTSGNEVTYVSGQDLSRWGAAHVVKINGVDYTIETGRVISSVDTSTDTLTSTSHGLSNGDKVHILSIGGGVPAPLSQGGEWYYIRDAAANTFKLAATPGGAVINLTSTGSGTIYVKPNSATSSRLTTSAGNQTNVPYTYWGPGATYMDVEPNNPKDIMELITLEGNIIDARGAANTANGILAQAVSGVTEIGPVSICNNLIIGGDNTNSARAEVNIATAIWGVLLKDSVIANNCVRIAAGGGVSCSGSNVGISNNVLMDCGAGAGSSVDLSGLTNSKINDNIRQASGVLFSNSNISEDSGAGGNFYSGNINFTYDSIQASSHIKNFVSSGKSYEFASLFASKPVSPAQITANQNNYNPGVGVVFRISTDASRNITGMVAGYDGEWRRIINIGSADAVFTHQDANSTAANRILSPTAANLTVAASQGIDVIYDGTTQRWRVVSAGGGTSYSVFGASGSSHSTGLVPDPGATAGTSKFLREDATWVDPTTSSVFYGARAYHSAQQSISNNTWTALAFNSESYDTDTIHDTSTNNTRLTCKHAGKHAIGGWAVFDGNSTGVRGVRIRLNGTTTLSEVTLPNDGASAWAATIEAEYDLAVNDYVEVEVFQDSGGSLNAQASVAGWMRRTEAPAPTFIGAHAYHSSTQSTTSATFTAMALNSERYDTDTIHDNSTNNTRLTCKTAGKYSIGGFAECEASALGIRFLGLRLNGSTYLSYAELPNNGSGSVWAVSVSGDYDLAVNDYIELVFYQDSGGSRTVNLAEAWMHQG